MTKLTDLCDIQYGYAFDSGAFTNDNSYPQLVRIRDVKRGYSETFYNGDYPDEYVLSAGDLLIGMDGEFNIARWKIDGALLNQRVCKIVAKDSTDEEFLRFALSKALKVIEDRTSFVTVKHLSARELNKLEIQVPSYDEQKKISDILHRLERIIDARQNELKSLDILIKARFVEMFGDVITNEKEWPLKQWDQILQIVNGRNQKQVQSDNGKYPIFGSGGEIGRATDYLTKENSVILGRKGNINKPILMKEKFWNVDTAFGIEPNSDYLLVEYLFQFCQLFNFEKLNKTVTIPSLTKLDLKKIEMPIPPLNLQEKFADFVKQVDKSKVAVQKALDEAQLLFDSLMQEYFG